MKKTFYIIALGLLGLVGFTQADVSSLNVAPATQTALSGSLVTFTVTGTTTTGDMYLKYTLPKTAMYDIAYQNSNLTPINNRMLSMGGEHDPVFYIPANSNFSVTITAKAFTPVRSMPTINTVANFGIDQTVSTSLTSAIAQITPIADLLVTNILTGQNPSISGDIVTYYITLQNIGSTTANGVMFISNFPIPTLFTPTAIFNNITHTYNYINYPQDFVWTGSYLNLNAGQIMTILMNAPMTQNLAVGTTFNQIAKVIMTSPEYATGNNSATAAGVVQAPANIWITKTLTPFTGYRAGDIITYTLTYGNNGGKAANNVVITDLVPTGITIPVNTFTIGTLPAGSGGTIVLTGTLNATSTSGTTFVNTATITTTSSDSTTGDNKSTVTGIVQGIAGISVNITANNLSRPQLDNAPYGSGPSNMIQAASGDIVQLTITYANNGNTVGTHAILYLSGIQGFTIISNYNMTINIVPIDYTGTIVLTGIVGPRNYISFSPSVRLTHDIGEFAIDNINIQEPLICGDGLLTRNEPCDTAGNLGVLYAGQVCQNQQGACVLVTQSIINNACINYQFNNQLGGITTGQSCSSATATLTNATCNIMTGAAPVVNGSNYSVNLTCRGNTTSSTTPLTINCGNGTTVSGFGSSVNGTCNYTSSFVGNAQCVVGNDASNAACRLPVSANAGQCQSLDALDGTIAIVNSDGDADSTFRCETVNGNTAQTIAIDCGNGTQHTANNVSVLEAGCEYTNVNIPQTYNVRCLVDGVTTPACQQNLIVDEGTFGRCGDGVRQGYEDCDDGNLNGTSSSSCTVGCDLKNALPVGCFNVGNANLSIQENELLPFWRTVDGEKNAVSTCNENNKNKVQTNSLQCTFTIYNKNGEVKTITTPCKNTSTASIFNYFAPYTTNAYGKFYTTIDSNITDGIYGEYKIGLSDVSYNYCDGTDFVAGAPLNRVCETNFTVTKSYLAQKSSFGLVPTATNIDILDNFWDIRGNHITDSTDLDQVMIRNASAYAGGTTITTMMNAFITKYEKIAIKGATMNNGIVVYKVPKQNIVVFKGEGELTFTEDQGFTTPFTMIVDGPNLVIKGSITKTNAMFLVNKGTIKFIESSTDACTKNQVVKGIFVTKNTFVAGDSLVNDSANQQWCPYGGLDVQGVLIGNGISNIVNSRRSQLNHWFRVGGTSEAAIKAERRNEIFNGAALLIEYSPSLWSALPPGASDFTKALDIYKQ